MAARILIVEDNADNLKLMKYLLHAFGHIVLTASDGEEGLEVARRETRQCFGNRLRGHGLHGGADFIHRPHPPQEELVARDRLEAVKSHLRYSFGLSLDNTESIADAVAHVVPLARTPATIDRLYALYGQLTPEDIRALVHSTLRHRILLGYRAEADGVTVDAVVDRLLEHLKGPFS